MLMVMNDFIGFLLSAIIGRCKNSIHFFFFYHCDLLLTSSWNHPYTRSANQQWISDRTQSSDILNDNSESRQTMLTTDQN